MSDAQAEQINQSFTLSDGLNRLSSQLAELRPTLTACSEKKIQTPCQALGPLYYSIVSPELHHAAIGWTASCIGSSRQTGSRNNQMTTGSAVNRPNTPIPNENMGSEAW